MIDGCPMPATMVRPGLVLLGKSCVSFVAISVGSLLIAMVAWVGPVLPLSPNLICAAMAKCSSGVA